MLFNNPMSLTQSACAADFKNIFIHDFFLECSIEYLQPKSNGVEPGVVAILKDKVDGENQNALLGIIKIVNNPIKEKYLDIMKYFSFAPNAYIDFMDSDELRVICTMFEFKKNEELSSSKELLLDESQDMIEQLIDRDVNNTPIFNNKHIVFFSQLLDDYCDLRDCFVSVEGANIPFMDFINDCGYPPEYIIHPNYPSGALRLTGLMSVAACAKLTGDIDWLGGSAMNTGVHISTSPSGEKVLRAINVDVGFAVTNENASPLHDIQFASSGNMNFKLSSLPTQHYNEFMQSLCLLVYRYPENERHQFDQLLNLLIKRNGIFEKNGLSIKDMNCISSKIENNLLTLEKLYGRDMSEYYKSHQNEIDLLLIEARKKDELFLKSYIQNVHSSAVTALSFFSGVVDNKVVEKVSGFFSKFKW